MADADERVRVIRTDDGSRTLQRLDSGWTYRSTRGATSESRHVFVDGSNILLRPRPHVLEFGFGGGTNFATLLTALGGREAGDLVYDAIEREPVAPRMLPEHDELSARLARLATEAGEARHQGVCLTLHRCAFEDFSPRPLYDAVFFDPFGPEDEPGSWTVDIFARAAAALRLDGRLATYSAAGWIRRNMAEAGLFVATVPGPPGGKREFTIAARSVAALGGAKVRNAPR